MFKMSGKKAPLDSSCRDESLLKEYELSQKMHNYYGRIIWEIGSIFMGGGLAAIALIVSRATRPSVVPALASLAFTVLMACFYLIVRRFRNIAEVHLRRCRQIEKKLGLCQHRYVRLAARCNGITIDDDTVKGETDRRIKIPLPTGWGITQALIIGLIVVSWIIAIFFLVD